MKCILHLNSTAARQYFLQTEIYVNFDLPHYFAFQSIIQQVATQLTDHKLEDFLTTYTDSSGKSKKRRPSDFENVNYKFLNNKDGKYAWRPFQLIHPVLYVSLVHNITEKDNWNIIVNKFEEFASNPKIKCYSIPLESKIVESTKGRRVTEWWEKIEQQSIELALQYEYILHTDISDCYGSIYTHSIPWAIHTKLFAKIPANRDNPLFIGNVIDRHLRDMAFGQTNGIPQGSVLMDFIAEIVLGYADNELSIRIQKSNIQDYQIIRYRDDYRIFSNNPQNAELITKILTEVLIELGMKLNTQKTLISNNVIRDSIKPDKIYWIGQKDQIKNIQKNLLLIHTLSEKFPNSGSLLKALGKFHKKIEHLNYLNNSEVLISIVVDIMYKNPKTYPYASAIISKLLSFLQDVTKREDILQFIMKKFEKIPNTGHLDVWLQRLTIKIDRKKIYKENLCKKVNDTTIQIWDSSWLTNPMKNIIDTTPITEEKIIQESNLVINSNEVALFKLNRDS